MSTNIIFILIILIYAAIGASKGFIRSIGGLIALILSSVLSKLLAAPITTMLFDFLNMNEKISSYLTIINDTTAISGEALKDGLNQFNNIVSVGSIDASEPVDKATQMISELVDKIAMNIGSVIVMIILFSIFMFIFGMIVRCFEKVFKTIPLGTTMNTILGIVVGVIEGIIVAILVFYMLSVLNYIPGVNIPLDDTIIYRATQEIGGIVANVRH